MLQTMRADGKMTEETITRLPKSSTLEKSYSALVSTDGNKNLKLVLNMASQEIYSSITFHDFYLLTVLERQKGSIPATVYTPQPLLVESSTTLGKRTTEEIQHRENEEEERFKKQR